MKRACLSAFALIASFLLQSAGLAGQDAVTANSRDDADVPKTSREWKQLRGRAKTPTEYRALSKWCDSQANECRRHQSSLESELRDYYANYCCYNPVKQRPRRDETLKSQIESCKRDDKRWSDLATVYSAKARALESASAAQ